MTEDRRGFSRLSHHGSARQLAVPALALAALIVYPMLGPFSKPFPQHLMIMAMLYATVSMAWNILGGFAGQFSFGHSLYFGLGAYTSTMLWMKLDITPWLGLLAGGVVAVLVSVAVGYPTFRLEGRHFSIATMALPEIVAVLFNNWKFVNEAIGIFMPMKPQSLLNFQFHSSKLPYYYIMLGFMIISLIVAWALENSRPGYYFKAIRENPMAARSLGIDITKYKQIAGAVSAFLTAAVGTFYAQYILYINPPSMFQSVISMLVVLICGLGGMGTLWGPILGAFVLTPISELTRVRWGGEGRGVHLVYYGLLLMLIAIYQPQGLIGWFNQLRGRFGRGAVRSQPANEKVRRPAGE
jgi:branched-chain amino acid transport system permease protein